MCGVYVTVLYHSFLAVILDVIEALRHLLDAQWREFGMYLCVQPAVMDGIQKECLKRKDHERNELCMVKLVEKWLDHENGTGDLPRTWETVVQTVEDTGETVLADQLARKHRLTTATTTAGKHE